MGSLALVILLLAAALFHDGCAQMAVASTPAVTDANASSACVCSFGLQSNITLPAGSRLVTVSTFFGFTSILETSCPCSCAKNCTCSTTVNSELPQVNFYQPYYFCFTSSPSSQYTTTVDNSTTTTPQVSSTSKSTSNATVFVAGCSLPGVSQTYPPGTYATGQLSGNLSIEIKCPCFCGNATCEVRLVDTVLPIIYEPSRFCFEPSLSTTSSGAATSMSTTASATSNSSECYCSSLLSVGLLPIGTYYKTSYTQNELNYTVELTCGCECGCTCNVKYSNYTSELDIYVPYATCGNSSVHTSTSWTSFSSYNNSYGSNLNCSFSLPDSNITFPPGTHYISALPEANVSVIISCPCECSNTNCTMITEHGIMNSLFVPYAYCYSSNTQAQTTDKSSASTSAVVDTPENCSCYRNDTSEAVPIGSYYRYLSTQLGVNYTVEITCDCDCGCTCGVSKKADSWETPVYIPHAACNNSRTSASPSISTTTITTTTTTTTNSVTTADRLNCSLPLPDTNFFFPVGTYYSTELPGLAYSIFILCPCACENATCSLKTVSGHEPYVNIPYAFCAETNTTTTKPFTSASTVPHSTPEANDTSLNWTSTTVLQSTTVAGVLNYSVTATSAFASTDNTSQRVTTTEARSTVEFSAAPSTSNSSETFTSSLVTTEPTTATSSSISISASNSNAPTTVSAVDLSISTTSPFLSNVSTASASFASSSTQSAESSTSTTTISFTVSEVSPNGTTQLLSTSPNVVNPNTSTAEISAGNISMTHSVTESSSLSSAISESSSTTSTSATIVVSASSGIQNQSYFSTSVPSSSVNLVDSTISSSTSVEPDIQSSTSFTEVNSGVTSGTSTTETSTDYLSTSSVSTEPNSTASSISTSDLASLEVSQQTKSPAFSAATEPESASTSSHSTSTSTDSELQTSIDVSSFSSSSSAEFSLAGTTISFAVENTSTSSNPLHETSAVPSTEVSTGVNNVSSQSVLSQTSSSFLSDSSTSSVSTLETEATTTTVSNAAVSESSLSSSSSSGTTTSSMLESSTSSLSIATTTTEFTAASAVSSSTVSISESTGIVTSVEADVSLEPFSVITSTASSSSHGLGEIDLTSSTSTTTEPQVQTTSETTGSTSVPAATTSAANETVLGEATSSSTPEVTASVHLTSSSGSDNATDMPTSVSADIVATSSVTPIASSSSSASPTTSTPSTSVFNATEVTSASSSGTSSRGSETTSDVRTTAVDRGASSGPTTASSAECLSFLPSLSVNFTAGTVLAQEVFGLNMYAIITCPCYCNSTCTTTLTTAVDPALRSSTCNANSTVSSTVPPSTSTTATTMAATTTSNNSCFCVTASGDAQLPIGTYLISSASVEEENYMIEVTCACECDCLCNTTALANAMIGPIYLPYFFCSNNSSGSTSPSPAYSPTPSVCQASLAGTEVTFPIGTIVSSNAEIDGSKFGFRVECACLCGAECNLYNFDYAISEAFLPGALCTNESSTVVATTPTTTTTLASSSLPSTTNGLNDNCSCVLNGNESVAIGSYLETIRLVTSSSTVVIDGELTVIPLNLCIKKVWTCPCNCTSCFCTSKLENIDVSSCPGNVTSSVTPYYYCPTSPIITSPTTSPLCTSVAFGNSVPLGSTILISMPCFQISCLCDCVCQANCRCSFLPTDCPANSDAYNSTSMVTPSRCLRSRRKRSVDSIYDAIEPSFGTNSYTTHLSVPEKVIAASFLNSDKKFSVPRWQNSVADNFTVGKLKFSYVIRNTYNLLKSVKMSEDVRLSAEEIMKFYTLALLHQTIIANHVMMVESMSFTRMRSDIKALRANAIVIVDNLPADAYFDMDSECSSAYGRLRVRYDIEIDPTSCKMTLIKFGS